MHPEKLELWHFTEAEFLTLTCGKPTVALFTQSLICSLCLLFGLHGYTYHRHRVLVRQNVFFQVTGKCGSVTVRLIPAPRGTGIVAAGVSKKLLQMAGVEDCYTSACGTTATVGNFGKWIIEMMWRQILKSVERLPPPEKYFLSYSPNRFFLKKR